MSLVVEESLGRTIDNVAEALFFGRPIAAPDKKEAALFIAGRQGLPRSYAGMFAPTDLDFETGFRVFTGELIKTGAGTSHIIGEEASRTLFALGSRERAVTKALDAANRGLLPKLSHPKRLTGTICCGICDVAFWRNMTVGGVMGIGEVELAKAALRLKENRTGKGDWRRYPFYYTLLALLDLDNKGVMEELRYAAPLVERRLKSSHSTKPYDLRRRELARRILART